MLTPGGLTNREAIADLERRVHALLPAELAQDIVELVDAALDLPAALSEMRIDIVCERLARRYRGGR